MRVIVLFLFLQATVAGSQTLDTTLWITNGPVNAVAKHGNNLYLGGKFDYIGPSSGFGTIADTTLRSLIPGFPKVNGPVYTVWPDHAGGWYIGGSFTRVGGYIRNNMAKITKDGKVDVKFAASFNGPVYVIRTNFKYASSQAIYAGGSFTLLNGIPCNNLVALNPFTGGNYKSWFPKVNGPVYSICVYDTSFVHYEGLKPYEVYKSIIFGGSFSRVEDMPVQNIASVKIPIFQSTVEVVSNFNPLANGTVRCLYWWKDKIIAGGDFTTIGNRFFPYLSALQAWGNGNAINLNFKVTGPVYAMMGSRCIKLMEVLPPPSGNPNIPPLTQTYNISSKSIYVGGNFSSVDGITRKNLAEYDLEIQKVTPWNPLPDSMVTSITVSPKYVYVAGKFTMIGGKNAEYFAELDKSTGQATTWTMNLSDHINAIMLSGNKLYFGGEFNSMNGVKRKNLASVAMNTGQATPFDLPVNSEVDLLKIYKDVLYVGGTFTKIGTSSRTRFASVDLNNLTLTSFNLTPDGPVRTIYGYENSLYIGGYFSKLGNKSRNNLACYLLDSSVLSIWNPDVNGTVNSVLLLNDKVYAGGYFTRIGNYSRNYLASIRIDKGLPTAWDPKINAGVYSLAEQGGKIYAGGWFDTIAGEAVKSLAMFDAVTEAWDNTWKLDFGSYVKSVKVNNERLFALGGFVSVNGQIRDKFVECDITTQQPTAWIPGLGHTYGTVKKNMIETEGNTVYIGGSFINAEDHIQSYLAVYHNLVTGIKNEEKKKEPLNSFNIYPNPASGEMTIEWKEGNGKTSEIIISNILGVEVIKEQVQTDNGKILLDVSGLTEGSYIIRIKQDDKMNSGKFIKSSE